MPDDVKELSVAELAYAAGLIDGEGCIRVCKLGQCTNGRVYTLRVQVNATSEAMIRFLHDRWGGTLEYLDSTELQVNRCPQWRWQINSKIAASFLDAIYPYLLVKKEQAMFGRAFQALMRNWGYGGRPAAIVELQERFFQKFKVLNARGADRIARDTRALEKAA